MLILQVFLSTLQSQGRADGRIVGGTEKDITRHTYQVWPLCCSLIRRYFVVFEQKRPNVFVMNNLSSQNIWLCAAAEVSLTEQKKTGDSLVLFVASSTALQFHFT
jgi:hypothetical protein